MPDARVEGASPEEEAILRELLADLGSHRIASVLVRPYEPDFEGEPAPPPGPHGDEIVVATEPADLRGTWEAQLFATAFARRSNAARLTSVAWLTLGRDGHAIVGAPAAAPLSAAEIERFRSGVAAEAGGATVERFDVLRPQGHAIAITLRVGEPHAFLRSSGRPLVYAVPGWQKRCDGVFAEIRDAGPHPVLAFGWHRYGGLSSTRRDVECCAPISGRGGLMAPPPPRCPVFG